ALLRIRGAVALIAHTKERYLRDPRLVAEGSGVTLYTIAWDAGAGEALLAFPIDASGEPGEPRVITRAPAIVALTRTDGVPAPSEDPGEVDRARAGAWAAWIERAEGVSRVCVRLPSGREVDVWEAHGTAAAPAIAL